MDLFSPPPFWKQYIEIVNLHLPLGKKVELMETYGIKVPPELYWILNSQVLESPQCLDWVKRWMSYTINMSAGDTYEFLRTRSSKGRPFNKMSLYMASNYREEIIEFTNFYFSLASFYRLEVPGSKFVILGSFQRGFNLLGINEPVGVLVFSERICAMLDWFMRKKQVCPVPLMILNFLKKKENAFQDYKYSTIFIGKDELGRSVNNKFQRNK